MPAIETQKKATEIKKMSKNQKAEWRKIPNVNPMELLVALIVKKYPQRVIDLGNRLLIFKMQRRMTKNDSRKLTFSAEKIKQDPAYFLELTDQLLVEKGRKYEELKKDEVKILNNILNYPAYFVILEENKEIRAIKKLADIGFITRIMELLSRLSSYQKSSILTCGKRIYLVVTRKNFRNMKTEEKFKKPGYILMARGIIRRLRKEKAIFSRKITSLRESGMSGFKENVPECNDSQPIGYFEVDSISTIINSGKKIIPLINEAIKRVLTGTYSIYCQECGDAMNQRLNSVPFAIICASCKEDQNKRERS